MDTSAYLEQHGGIIAFRAYDWVDNFTDTFAYTLGIDRTAPTVSATAYQYYGDAPFRDFYVRWDNGSDELSGIASYDVQVRDGASGTWTDHITDTTAISTEYVGEDGHTYYFRARARDNAGNQSAYAEPDGDAEHTVTICPAPADSYETDDDYLSASWITTNGTVQTHNIHLEQDEDWVKFEATAGITYTLVTSNMGGHADTWLYLYDTDGSTLLADNDDYGANFASRIIWQAAADGIYFARVNHYDEWAYGCTTEYTLSVTGEGTSNSAPVAVEDGYVVLAGEELIVAAPGVLENDSDEEGDELTAVLASDASHGVLVLALDGSFSYTPEAGYVGADSFSYRADDGSAQSNEATVTLTVQSGSIPAAPALTSPGGVIDDSTPAYTWHEATGAAEYQLYVVDGDGAFVLAQWLPAAVVCDGGVCS